MSAVTLCTTTAVSLCTTTTVSTIIIRRMYLEDMFKDMKYYNLFKSLSLPVAQSLDSKYSQNSVILKN